MDWSVELGRAVLSPLGTNLELWLTTLINISPKQYATNLQDVSTASLIEFLSSGEAWVERGQGMHILFDITWRGEPLGSNELRLLAEGIVHAPAWKQLNLQPSLPLRPQPHPGRLQINIAQLRGDVDRDPKKGHRICANVPPADFRPPEGIPTLALQSVHMSLVLSENRAKTISLRQRERKQQTAVNDVQARAITSSQNNLSTPDMLFTEHADFIHGSDDESLLATPESHPPALNRKRERPSTLPSKPQRDVQSSTGPVRQTKRRRTNTISGRFVARAETPNAPGSQLFQDMIDAAVRLSLSNNLRGSKGGWKINANTFAEGLADIAPALWRPGYINAIAQRAYLIPTISTCFGRMSSRTKSATLQDKAAQLANPRYKQNRYLSHVDPVNRPLIDKVTATVATRIWVSSQKMLLSKPVQGIIQSYCVPAIQDWTLAEHDDILEAIDDKFHDHVAFVATNGKAHLPVEQSSTEMYPYPAYANDKDNVEQIFPSGEHGLRTTATPTSRILPAMDSLAVSSSLHHEDSDIVNEKDHHSGASGGHTNGIDIQSKGKAEVEKEDEDLFATESFAKDIPMHGYAVDCNGETPNSAEYESHEAATRISIPTF